MECHQSNHLQESWQVQETIHVRSVEEKDCHQSWLTLTTRLETAGESTGRINRFVVVIRASCIPVHQLLDGTAKVRERTRQALFTFI